MSGRTRGPSRGVAALSAALFSLSVFLGLAVVAAQDRFFDLDHETRHVVQGWRQPVLDGTMTGLTRLGENPGLLVLMAIGSGLLWRRHRAWAIALPAIMAGTGVLQYVAKWAVDRPRPNLAAWGFPSGHTLSLVVFFGLVAYLLWTSGARRRWRWSGGGACAAVVLSVAFTRLYLEAHWITDVVGGFALGLAYLLGAIWVVERLATAGAAVGLDQPVTGPGIALDVTDPTAAA
jgi:undecaprenyl-diphosphatase